MAAGAAELVDHILPHVPIRQGVLSLPHALRYRLAWDHALCRGVLASDGEDVEACAATRPPQSCSSMHGASP